MPYQGTPVAIWILMCLALASIWIVTILLVRTLIGGRPGRRATDVASPRGGEASWRESEPERGTLTTPLPPQNRIPITRGGQ